MAFNADEFALLWDAIAASAENEEDMEGLDGDDPVKRAAKRALCDRFDAIVAASAGE
jgi:hypothetical protein